jgi:Zn-dependent M28 family amino/carboxypeptidase
MNSLVTRTSALLALALLQQPAGVTWAQTATTAADRIDADIAFLAADAREGRGVGTAGLDSAASYVARQFEAAGLLPHPAGGFLQRFTIDSSAPAAAHAGLGGVEVSNVVGIYPGRGNLADQAVVIGAHYDHLGYGGFGSLDPDSVRVVHNGADDNASGTAVMIEVARMLQSRSTANARSVVFVAFTAEELGLIGSSYYVNNPLVANDSTFAMINLDMVGRLTDERLAVFGVETAREFRPLLDSVNSQLGFDLAASGDGYGRSDQQSFFVAKIPVLHFFTGTHENYHRTSDDAERINAEGAARVAAFVAEVTWKLATRHEPLSFVDAEPPQMSTSGGYGAYLGTIPDMTDSPNGVRLSGVRNGSPADSAGIRAGDILVGIGEFDISDLYEMTDALRAHKPGETVLVRVRRGEEVVELTATLGRRGG